jgi:phenylacetate-coenzyme A ligase PaaK-like adenylate-forming protein
MYDRQQNHQPRGKVAAIVSPTWLHASLPIQSSNLGESIEVQHFPASMPLLKIAKALDEYQPKQLREYSSIISERSHLANAGKLRLGINRISANSEPLNTDDRNSIRQAWNVEGNNLWGRTEIGMMAIENGEHFGMWIFKYCE